MVSKAQEPKWDAYVKSYVAHSKQAKVPLPELSNEYAHPSDHTTSSGDDQPKDVKLEPDPSIPKREREPSVTDHIKGRNTVSVTHNIKGRQLTLTEMSTFKEDPYAGRKAISSLPKEIQ